MDGLVLQYSQQKKSVQKSRNRGDVFLVGASDSSPHIRTAE